MENKQKQLDSLMAQVAEINETIEAMDAWLDNFVESNPEKLFDIWKINPQEAIRIAERLGMNCFLDTHAI